MCCFQRYMSKFRPSVVLEKKLTKEAMKTMGPPKVEVPSPEKYLKKHSKEPKLPESEFSNTLFYKYVFDNYYSPLYLSFSEKQCPKEVCKTCSMKKPAVPARTDNPPMGIYTKRDFIKTNTAMPMKPQPTCVDTNKGHKERLENSGLVPKYIKKRVKKTF